MVKKNNKKSDKLENFANITDETQKKLEEIKSKLDKYKDKVLEKFEEYVLGMSLLPPSKDDKNKEKINVLLLIEDTDSNKMSKEELKDKLSNIMIDMAKKIDKSLNPEVLLLSELWQIVMMQNMNYYK